MARNKRRGSSRVTLDGERIVPRVPRPMRQGGKPAAVGNYVQDAWSLAKRTAVGLNEIRKLINVEHKFLDTGATQVASQAGTVSALNLIAQGDNVGQRDGDAVKMQSLEFTALCFTGGNSGFLRIMIVKDAQNLGATITGADVLQTSGGIYTPASFPNFINSPNIQSRFSVLLDQVVRLDPSKTNEIVRFKSTHDVHLYYRDTAATLASLASGALFVILLTDLAATQPSVVWQSRVIFTDN